MLPRLRFIVAIDGELYFFTHSASTRAHISDWPVAVHFVSMWSIVSVRIHVYSGVQVTLAQIHYFSISELGLAVLRNSPLTS